MIATRSESNFVIPIVAGIGNALMAEPMVRQLRRGLPEAHIRVVATSGAMGEPFSRIPGVQVTISGSGSWKLFSALRRAAPVDVLIVPFPSNRWQYNALALRSGAKRVVMHAYPEANRAWLSGMIRDRVEAVRGIHDVVQNLKLLNAVGVKPRFGDRPAFEVSPDDRAAADSSLRHAGVGSEQFIAVHAGSARTILAAAKRWPVSKYVELIGRMQGHTGSSVVVLEGPDELGVADSIVNRGGPAGGRACALRLSGPLGVAGAILKRSSLYVGTDSGLAHLAAAVGTRAVTLFAPADPTRVCPFGNDDLVVRPDKPCSPCFMYPWESTKPKMRCREPYCVTEITVEMVMQKVTVAWAARP